MQRCRMMSKSGDRERGISVKENSCNRLLGFCQVLSSISFHLTQCDVRGEYVNLST
jgi:hypothetical protein